MLNIGFQFFAHKKGGGSTKNGRDSEAKRLGGEAPTSTPARTWASAATTPCSL